MYRLFLASLIIISCTQSQKNSNPLPQADSLQKFIKKTTEIYFDAGDTISVKKFLDSLHPAIQKINDPNLTSVWLQYKQLQHNASKNYDSATFYMNKALALSHRKNAPLKEVLSIQVDLLDLLKDQKKFDSALKVGNEAYYLAKQIDTSKLAMICFRLSQIHAALENFPAMRRFLMEGFARAKTPSLVSAFANNIAYYYDRYGQTDSAIYFFKKAQKEFPFQTKKLQAILNENIGILLIRKGNLEGALPYLLSAMNSKRESGEVDLESMLNLSSLYAQLKQFGKAQLYIDSALSLAVKANNLNLQKEAWHNKAYAYRDEGKYREAYAAMDSAYMHYHEEVDSSLRQYANDLETKYAVKEKDNQINSLNITNQANLRIRKQQRITIITIIIGVALLSFVAFLLYRRRQTQMLLRETSLKQQLLRAQMDPHFVFNSLGLLQNLIRTGEAEKAIGYLNNLAKLMRFNFENASESQVILKNEIDALENYLKLQELYRPGLFTYTINVYEGYEDDEVYIPPMLLQPFVENSIQHGFSKLNIGGKLLVAIERRQSTLFCVIDDNGIGTAQSPKFSKGRSTELNYERLSILTKQTGIPAKLSIIDKKSRNNESGTRVEIEIPFRTRKRSQKIGGTKKRMTA